MHQSCKKPSWYHHQTFYQLLLDCERGDNIRDQRSDGLPQRIDSSFKPGEADGVLDGMLVLPSLWINATLILHFTNENVCVCRTIYLDGDFPDDRDKALGAQKQYDFDSEDYLCRFNDNCDIFCVIAA